MLRDSETELLFKDISRPLIQAAKLDPNSVNVALFNDPEINAFVATGQTVYIQSGLIEATDNVNQLQGVIAHELGHVAGGHSIRMQDGVKAGDRDHHRHMVLGALAIAAGAGEAGDGADGGWPAGGDGQVPRLYPHPGSLRRPGRGQISSCAGITGKGMLQFFSKLQNEEYRLAIYDKDSYDRDPPAFERTDPGARAELQGRPGLEQADRSGARSALPAGQGQALRLR